LVDGGTAGVVVSAAGVAGSVLVGGSVSVLVVVAGSVVVVGDVVTVVVVAVLVGGSGVVGGASARAAVATPLPKSTTVASAGMSFVRTTTDDYRASEQFRRISSRRMASAHRR